ncbi:MAG: hypothetical protein J6Z45_05620 [Oscillospiraceae bacterium]|nr:hypothetical protein [Oscillospiraceae bacterium]
MMRLPLRALSEKQADTKPASSKEKAGFVFGYARGRYNFFKSVSALWKRKGLFSDAGYALIAETLAMVLL